MESSLLGAFDIQVVAQAVVYLVLVIFGFAIAVPVGISVNDFENHCILYTDISWKNETYFTYKTSSPNVCNFPVGAAVFTCILYGLGMGVYNIYAVCRTKDSNVGFNMWVMPFILANSLICILMFVIACMISVGLKQVCDALVDDSHHIKSCAQTQKLNWNKSGNTHVNASRFYTFIKAAEVAAWIAVLLWLVQVGFYILRFIRIRRFRAKDMGIPETAPGTRVPEDMSNFAAANPSA